jgi:hypothetical protein
MDENIVFAPARLPYVICFFFFFILLKLLKIPSKSFLKKIEKVTRPIYIHMIVCVVFTLRE